jgi:hypothetical protein
VKESKLLQKNVPLPLTIPLVVFWGKQREDVQALHALGFSRYCHDP